MTNQMTKVLFIPGGSGRKDRERPCQEGSKCLSVPIPQQLTTTWTVEGALRVHVRLACPANSSYIRFPVWSQGSCESLLPDV